MNCDGNQKADAYLFGGHRNFISLFFGFLLDKLDHLVYLAFNLRAMGFDQFLALSTHAHPLRT
jgi:hypothetical protein